MDWVEFDCSSLNDDLVALFDLSSWLVEGGEETTFEGFDFLSFLDANVAGFLFFLTLVSLLFILLLRLCLFDASPSIFENDSESEPESDDDETIERDFDEPDVSYAELIVELDACEDREPTDEAVESDEEERGEYRDDLEDDEDARLALMFLLSFFVEPIDFSLAFFVDSSSSLRSRVDKS